jgi:hypothetical protein
VCTDIYRPSYLKMVVEEAGGVELHVL